MRLFHPTIFILFFCASTSKAQLQFELDFNKFKNELDSKMAADPGKEYPDLNDEYILVYRESWEMQFHHFSPGDSSLYSRNKYVIDSTFSYAGAHGCIYSISYCNDDYLVLYCSLPTSMPMTRWLYFRRKL